MWVQYVIWKDPWKRALQPTPVFLPGDPMDRGVWQATVHRVTQSWTWLRQLSKHAYAQFESIDSWVLSLLYGPAITSIHCYRKDHLFDYTDLCWQSDVSGFYFFFKDPQNAGYNWRTTELVFPLLIKHKWKSQHLQHVRKWSESVSCSLICDSLRPHGLQPTRLCCPWDIPGKNIGVGCYFLLQGIFPAKGLNPGLLHCKQIIYHLSHTRKSSVSETCHVFNIWRSDMGLRPNSATKVICHML